MERKKEIYYFLFLIIFAYFFNVNQISCKSYEIHVDFLQYGLQSLYCDDNIQFFGTNNINIYFEEHLIYFDDPIIGLDLNIRVRPKNRKILVNSSLIKDSSSFVCKSQIKININETFSTIIIEFKDNPKTLKKIFSGSSFYSIDRFDYPFPLDESDYNEMFYQSTELVYANLKNLTFENTIDVGSMFNYCKKLETIIFPQNPKSSNVESFSEMFAYAESLTSINLTNFSFAKTKNMAYMFIGCKNLESLILPSNEKESNVIDFYYKIEKMSYAFYNCYKLKSIDLSKFNLNLVTNLEYMLDSCSSLETIKLPEQKINNVENFFHTFNNCSKLKYIDLTNISFLKAKNIGFMFANCTNLLEIKFDQNEQITNINNMNGTFANCTSIKTIDIGHICISNNSILDNLFFNCPSLKEINISNIDTTKSSSTNNFLNNDYLENCSYYNLDNIHLNKSSVFKACSQSIFFHNNKNMMFYYLYI